MFKTFFSILAGLFTAFVIVLFFETLLPYIFNMKTGRPDNKQEMETFLSLAPMGLLISDAIGLGIAALAGTYITILISNNVRTGIITSGLFFIVLIINFVSYKHPLWMIISGCILALAGGYTGTKIRKNII